MATKTKAQIKKIARRDPKLAKRLEQQRLARNARVQKNRRKKRQEQRAAREVRELATFTRAAGQGVGDPPQAPPQTTSAGAANLSFVPYRKQIDAIVTRDKVDVYIDGARSQTRYDVAAYLLELSALADIATRLGTFDVHIHDARLTVSE